MPKQTYQPTDADRETGRNVRNLRRLSGETLDQTIERSGVGFGNSTLSKVELGQRPLTLPEATKLAAHFNTTPDRIICEPWETVTEQEWLGNAPTELFAVSDKPLYSEAELAEIERSIICPPTQLVIDRSAPLTPDEYRSQVWIPYLEQRYANDHLRQTG